MPTVIYVRGYDNKVEWVWRNAHPRGRRPPTTLAFFDYEDDEYREYRSWNGVFPPTAAPARSLAISTVIDLYEFVKNQRAGDVTELHFFTHGWSGGPLLHNTDEAFGTPSNSRDPLDADPRIKDFAIPSVLGGVEGQAFRQAFARNALVKLWGCNADDAGHRQLVKKDYFAARNDAERATIVRVYKQYIRETTYQYSMMRTLRLPVYAAPLGWGTSPHLPFGIEGERAASTRAVARGVYPPRRGDLWWRVSPHFRPDRGREFYSRVLRAKLDPLDYIAYTDALAR